LGASQDFGAGKLRKIILKGSNVSAESLGHLLRTCPSITAVEIGCDETLKDLICSFPNVRWVGDQNGVQSPKEGLSRERDVSGSKTKGLKVNGVRHRLRESSSREGVEFEMHPVSDIARKARSPNGYTSVVEETEPNESYQDSAVTHLALSAIEGVRSSKFNNYRTVAKSSHGNGTFRAVKEENGHSVLRLEQLKRKALPGLLQRKNDKASYKMYKPMLNGQRSVADKHSSTTVVKVEHHSKTPVSASSEGDRSLEKEMRQILRVIVEADINKCFQSVCDHSGIMLYVFLIHSKGGDFARVPMYCC
jgi:hypothetical protein